MKLSGINPALMACAGIVVYWFTSIYGVPEKVNQHDRDIAAIFARLNARDQADRDAAAEALKREGYTKNQKALQGALKESGRGNAAAIREMGEMFADALREVHGLPPKRHATDGAPAGRKGE